MLPLGRFCSYSAAYVSSLSHEPRPSYWAITVKVKYAAEPKIVQRCPSGHGSVCGYGNLMLLWSATEQVSQRRLYTSVHVTEVGDMWKGIEKLPAISQIRMPWCPFYYAPMFSLPANGCILKTQLLPNLWLSRQYSGFALLVPDASQFSNCCASQAPLHVPINRRPVVCKQLLECGALFLRRESRLSPVTEVAHDSANILRSCS